MLERAMLDHIKQTWKPGCVYALPLSAFDDESFGAGCGELSALSRKLGPKRLVDETLTSDELYKMSHPDALSGLASFSVDDDIVPAVNIHQGDFLAHEMVFFSIVDASPSRARAIPLPPGTASKLGPNDLQVCIHPHTSDQHSDSKVIAVGTQETAANPVLVLSRLGLNITGSQSSKVLHGRLQLALRVVAVSGCVCTWLLVYRGLVLERAKVRFCNHASSHFKGPFVVKRSCSEQAIATYSNAIVFVATCSTSSRAATKVRMPPSQSLCMRELFQTLRAVTIVQTTKKHNC
jgi:hypothetical protein